MSRTTYGPPSKRPSNKYHNQKTDFEGITFDSQKEARRYQELLALMEAGQIRQLERQPRYDLIVNGCKLGAYFADFRYELVETGAIVTEDVKSPATRTPLYRLKKKLVKALYDVDIVET
jgi:hypothetical protein